MDLSKPQPIRRYKDGTFSGQTDPVVEEIRIELDINDGSVRLGMLCLPRQLEALAIGFALGEGICRREDLPAIQIEVVDKEVFLRGRFDDDAIESIHRRWTWGTGCGSGGTSRDLDNPVYATLTSQAEFPAKRILELISEFHHRAELWRDTGGVHACALASCEGISIFAEDIGRHNAFDKIMGMAAMDGIDVDDSMVLTTGRLSAEIVSKAVACGVAVLASRSAVTSLALDVARRFGLTLIGFARAGRLNVYTGYHRIT